jgi:anion-transporting  ArsA/GET3 family ATPase
VTAGAWLDRRILVCVGTGGVGKTTVAAAIGLEAALRGKRVLVLTIDPARRLADALGAGPLSSTPRQIPPHLLPSSAGAGALFAMMLDTKRTFDALVDRYAPDDESRERILQNPIYRNLTDALAGSREYAAMEEVRRLDAEREYDLIVLDTPPARHALEFLDAPRRLVGFLESPISRLLLRPAIAIGRTSFRLFRFGSELLLRTLERVSGFEFLGAISDFLLAFEGMFDGFAARAHEVDRLLRSDACGFLLVAGPRRDQAAAASALFERLAQEEIDLVGVIVNRVRTWPVPGPIPRPDDPRWESDESRLAHVLHARSSLPDAEGLARTLIEVARRHASLAHLDERGIERLTRSLPLGPDAVRRLPLEAEDVHSLDVLARLGCRIFSPDAVVPQQAASDA